MKPKIRYYAPSQDFSPIKKLTKNLTKQGSFMPAKKAKAMKKTAKKPSPKTAKKPAVKKLPKKAVKKIVAKKPAPKAAPKAKKTVVKKIKAQKPKKVVKKTAVKKPAPKKIQKPQKSVVKKLPPVKAPKIKKEKEVAAKPQKIVAKQSTSLAKTILAKTSERKAEAKKAEANKVEAPKTPERKNEAPQKVIFVKKSEGRSKTTFKVGDYAVYPSHGIGKITDIEKTVILGQDFSCYLMYFEKEKLTIKIPINSAEKIGLRHLITKTQMDEVFTILRSGVKKLKGMWSRRAQEYETKINSGDIMLLAEVLRDLTRDIEDGERSYSERIIYETAIHRLASEYSAIYGIPFEEAKDKVVITAKDKLNSEGKVVQKDEFDDFELDGEESDLDEDEENEDEDEEEEDDEDGDDDDYDDDDDEKPRKRSRK